MEEYLQQINQDIKDIFQYNILTTKAYTIPTRDDASLTFPIGADKQGKLLETCVLMIDVRNSTKISRRLRRDKVRLGKIYSAFVYAMTNIADKYGFVRNIVGDRIMVVFEPKNCFVNAINCAALVYTVDRRILSKHIGLGDFKLGIGIDYGEMLVLKTGIRKMYREQSEHKGLVWVGDAANIASKLCDMASKSYSSPVFKLTYETIKYDNIFNYLNPTTQDSLLSQLINSGAYNPKPEVKSSVEYHSVDLNYADFAQKVTTGSADWKYEGKTVKSFNIVNRTGTTSPILMSGKVYNEYKKAEPKSNHLARLSLKNYPDRPYIPLGIYGGGLIIPEYWKIKL